jgi:predicted alpha/beta-hydrolase family hydrolase
MPTPTADPTPTVLTLADGTTVAGLLQQPAQARTGFVFAHGAGAGMHHAFMAAVATGLAQRGIASLRYQFPFMQRGSKRPDPPALAQATVRAAVGHAARQWPGLPLVAGGKSYGARMTSQADSVSPLPGVRGLAFVGFPLHPAGKPDTSRAEHLAAVRRPMLFLQGTRDELADLALLEPVVAALPTARLVRIEAADHAFHVPARSGRRDAEVLHELLDHLVAWIDALPG